MYRFKTLSLFTGAGGLDLGFNNNGFDITIANEIDKNAGKTYVLNHPNVNFIGGDIEKVLPELCKRPDVDVIIGGPPCQGFSVAGKMDYDDPRNKMVWRYLEVVDKLRPRAFVIENVKALYSLSKWRPIREKIIHEANNMGYSICPILLNAVDFGVPQKRFRVFFIAFRDKEILLDDLQARFSSMKQEAPTVRQVIGNLAKAGSKENPLDSQAKITFASSPILRKSPYSGMLFNGAGRPINLDGQANTLPASMGGNKTPIIDDDALYMGKDNFVVDYHKKILEGRKTEFTVVPQRLRRLTIKEAAMLQTFPSDYAFVGPKTSVYKQIGNAVPPVLAGAVARVVYDVLNDKPIKRDANNTPIQLSMFSK